MTPIWSRKNKSLWLINICESLLLFLRFYD